MTKKIQFKVKFYVNYLLIDCKITSLSFMKNFENKFQYLILISLRKQDFVQDLRFIQNIWLKSVIFLFKIILLHYICIVKNLNSKLLNLNICVV